MSRAAAPAADLREAWLAAFAAREARKEPSWLATRRRRAIERFEGLGLPTSRDEEWRSTNPAPVTKAVFRPAPPAEVPVAAALGVCTEASGSRLVFVNGRLDARLSRLPDASTRVRVSSLAAAIEEGHPALEGATSEDLGAFEALNRAFSEDGAFVLVPRETCLPLPLHLLFLTVASDAPTVCHPRNLLVLEPGTRAVVVETHADLGKGAPVLSNASTEVRLGTNSHLSRTVVQQRDATGLHLSACRVSQERDSRFESLEVSLGARFSRSELEVLLAGEGSECELYGLYLADGDRLVDHHTRIDHAVPHGTSRELYKGILDGRGHGVFSGRIRVRPDAQRTDARQANHNLLLSEDAVVDTKPMLEIEADDVKCSHGATVGQMDEDALFYLRSRGLSPETSRSLLLRAFAGEVTARAPTPDLRERLDRALAARLPGESLS